MPTITNGAGSSGTDGAIGSSSRQIDAPSKPPMTIPGPNTPPDPPEPMDSDVARILANGRASTIHSGRASSEARLSDAWTQPYPVPSTPGMTSASAPTQSPAMPGLSHGGMDHARNRSTAP